MTTPKTANSTFPISDADLASALAQIGEEIDHQSLRSSALARIMRETFLGSDAGGAWDWRMAYDLMQAAAIQVLLRGDVEAGDIATAKLLASRLLTENRRSEQQIRLQQFSTPLPFAAMVVRAAAIRKGETVLEPSAGTGALTAFAARAGATLMLNEIDPFRQRLLRSLFGGEVTGHDGEHIDDLLQTPVLPDVVVMNPPFASSVDRSRDKHIAAKHLIAAAKRLAPGGRLVAIMPPGFTPERDVTHWSRACGLLTPRLALTMPGQVYRKLGTSVETQLMVFDKVQEGGEMIRAIVCDLDEALPFVDAVAATRPEMRPVQRAAAIPHARSTVPSSAPRKTAAAPVAASKPRANAVVPLSFTSFESPRDNKPVSDIYARYRPQRIEIAGAQEHPTPLVESIAMASVAPPVPSNTGSDDLYLPARLIEEGDLSEAQLETIIMAHDAHGRDLPGRFTIDDDQTKLTRADDDPDARAYRLGYFLGDGTGCGKGRECAGLILVNWLAGRRKAIWVSKSATLIEDAIRDWTDLGGSPADIQPLSKWKPDQPIPMGDGILFVTYVRSRDAGQSHFEVTVGKSIPTDRPSRYLGLVQSHDKRPKRRLHEVLKDQGWQENQLVTFMTDGGDTVINMARHMAPASEHILDWFHITMRITVMQQYVKGLAHHNADEAEALSRLLRQIKDFLWNGNLHDAQATIDDMVMDIDEIETDYASIKALRKAAAEFQTYITNNAGMIPNYAGRRRYGERVSTGFVESTVNTVVGKRFGKRQQMRWSKQGAHHMLQTRARTLDGTLRGKFEQWYPGMNAAEDDRMAA